MLTSTLFTALGLLITVLAQSQADVDPVARPRRALYEKDLTAWSGYVATKHWETRSGFYAELPLAGPACIAYGIDLPNLKFEVEYQTEERLHVKILDTNNSVYQVPGEVFPRPGFGQ
jgi:alpha-glucosidase